MGAEEKLGCEPSVIKEALPNMGAEDQANQEIDGHAWQTDTGGHATESEAQ
jgi:hypothetical protein